MYLESGFGIAQIGHKSEKSQWPHNLLIWHYYLFFWHCFIPLVKFSYWSRFHVNIITGARVMTIFFYKKLTRNLATGNTPVWDLEAGDWGELEIPNLAQMSLIKCYWILLNARVMAFNVSELLRENQWSKIILPHPSTQIRVNPNVQKAWA